MKTIKINHWKNGLLAELHGMSVQDVVKLFSCLPDEAFLYVYTEGWEQWLEVRMEVSDDKYDLIQKQQEWLKVENSLKQQLDTLVKKHTEISSLLVDERKRIFGE